VGAENPTAQLTREHDDLDRELTVVTTCEPDQLADAQNQ
jgi:hypothetical protein